MRQWVRRAASAAAVSLSAGVAGLSLPAPALAVSPDIVISQVYGGGGNTGATYTNDFIELYNRGSMTVDVTGWTVQYASAAGSTWQTTALSGEILPGAYYLVQEAQGPGGTTPLPTPNAVGDIAMSLSSGKVALVTTSAPLACAIGCDTAAGVRDFVGYGSSATSAEGSPAPTLSNTTAALRDDDGAVDTDDNSVDFSAARPTRATARRPPPRPTWPSRSSTRRTR
ncbi:lamin tail domain-containing protein [Catellatospora coxensis]